MTKGRTTLIQKDPWKWTAPNNYRPITCLPMMWKIQAAQIREEIYFSLTSCGLFPDEQKGCSKESRGTGELLYLDQHILNKSKTRCQNLPMAWIDYKKSYDIVPQSWIINCLKTYKISDKVISFIEKTMKEWSWQLDGKLSRSKNPQRYIPRRCTITITIYKCYDATKFPYSGNSQPDTNLVNHRKR